MFWLVIFTALVAAYLGGYSYGYFVRTAKRVPAVMIFVISAGLLLSWIAYGIVHARGLGWKAAGYIAVPAVVFVLVWLFAAYKKGKLICWVALGLVLAMLASLIVPLLTHRNNDTPSEESAKNSSWAHYYNDDVVADGIKGNDYYFGQDPLSPIKEKAEAERLEAVRKEFAKRLSEDPALGTAVMGYTDAVLGTKNLGWFYVSNLFNWAETLNNTLEYFDSNKSAYDETLRKFYTRKDKCFNIQVEITNLEGLKKYGIVLSDLMYMEPKEIENAKHPTLIVCESKLKSGNFIVYEVTVKEGEEPHLLVFRLDCGFQPVNCAVPMGITPVGGSYEPGPTGGVIPPPVLASKVVGQDPVNQGNATVGGGNNTASSGSGQEQEDDPRITTGGGSGSNDSTTVTSPVTTGSSAEVIDENSMDYSTDDTTDYGATDGTEPTTGEGDGEWSPPDT